MIDARYLLPLLALALGYATAQALVVRDYDADRHDRFRSGFPEAPQANSGFLFDDYDLSSVGWDGDDQGTADRGLTLVSPRHFVGVNHWQPEGDLQVMNRDGELRTYSVETIHNIENDDNEPTDLILGELSSDIPVGDNVGFSPILSFATEAEYVGREVAVFGSGDDSPRGGLGEVGSFTTFGQDPLTGQTEINDTRAFTFQFVEGDPTGGPDDAHVEVGDSGSPSFIEFEDELALVGVHTAVVSAIGTETTFDTFVAHPPYIERMNAIMAETGHELTIVPEPGAVGLFMGGVTFVVLLGARRMRVRMS